MYYCLCQSARCSPAHNELHLLLLKIAARRKHTTISSVVNLICAVGRALWVTHDKSRYIHVCPHHACAGARGTPRMHCAVYCTYLAMSKDSGRNTTASKSLASDFLKLTKSAAIKAEELVGLLVDGNRRLHNCFFNMGALYRSIGSEEGSSDEDSHIFQNPQPKRKKLGAHGPSGKNNNSI